jgi:hypothetical protein
MGDMSKIIAIVLALASVVFWVIAIAVAYGWLGAASGWLYGNTYSAFAVYGVLTAAGAIGVYKMDF